MKLNLAKVNRTWVMLVSAIVLGLLAMFLTVQYLNLQERNLQSQIEQKMRGKGPLLSVVVPTSDLTAGTPVDLGVVAAREVPGDLVYDDAILVDQFDMYKGKALIRPVKQGRPLRAGDLREIYADFAGSLKPGTRAMTIETDELNSISNMVQPGNLIDLMLIMEQTTGGAGNDPSAGGKTSRIVVPFMLSVKVLATGQKITRDEAGPDGQPQRKSSYGTYTLEVTPGQAISIVTAQELGKLRAVLRNEKDAIKGSDPTVEYDSASAGDLMRSIAVRSQSVAKASAAAKVAASRIEIPAGDDPNSYIEYIIGGKGGSDGMTPTMNIPMGAGYGNISLGAPAGAPNPIGPSSSLPVNVMPTAATPAAPVAPTK
ncbi:Flp pilus assembly protein CpaB [Chitinimonas sp. BJYL2]|uniref:Flp pilus assembly protein CpaB n=1 Tax=Chitinimonas sp. BJYL2 TaxID=2976696 RepID=UPI0022B4987E|nr:Flp pilus assembly protein CpaB [Chitinimonas sp. BJYL2]